MTRQELIDALRKAEGPDRSLDAEITVVTTPTQSTADDLIYFRTPTKADGCAPGTYWKHQRSGMSLHAAAPLTASLDAAISLVVMVDPELELHIIVDRGRGFANDPLFETEIMKQDGFAFDVIGEGESRATPAIALMIAFLESMEAAAK